MEIESKVSVKKDNGEVVSADVMLYNNKGDVVKRITILDSDVLQNLESTIETFRNTYISNAQLTSALGNSNNDITINASKIMGVDGDKFALISDIPHTMEPTKHDSTTQNYGVGSTTKYGHVKVRDNLSATSFISGESLSAYQGALLNNNINTAQNQLNNLENKYKKNSLNVQLGRLRDGQFEQEYATRLQTRPGDKIYAHVTCDNPAYNLSERNVAIMFDDGSEFTYDLDNQGYSLDNHGRGGKVIEWPTNRHNLIYAFVPGDESLGLKSAVTIKRIHHAV